MLLLSHRDGSKVSEKGLSTLRVAAASVYVCQSSITALEEWNKMGRSVQTEFQFWEGRDTGFITGDEI